MNIKPDDYEQAFSIALKYLDLSERLQIEIEKKLAQKGFSQTTIEQVINQLIIIGYLDDQRAIKGFVENRIQYKSHGKRKIYFDLLNKGATVEALEEALSAVDSDQQLEAALNLLRKKYKTGDKHEKLLRFLFSRGFESEIIYEAWEKFQKELVSQD